MRHNDDPTISIIVPATNEAGGLGRTLESARVGRPREIIVVDGRSTDATVAVARGRGATVLHAPPGRASQLRAGAAEASGDILLFLHADTLLPGDYPAHVRRTLATAGVVAGAFQLAIDGPQPALRIIERCVAWRSRSWSRPYGDQALFMTRRRYEQAGGFPDVPIMEDVELVRRLRRLGRIAIAPATVLTSARRWHAKGIARTTALNQVCVAARVLGVPHRVIATWRLYVRISRFRSIGMLLSIVPATKTGQ